MPLVPATLEKDVLAIFVAMDDILDETGEDYQAEKMAKAVKKYILTGVTSTSDSGSISGNSYSGTGTGIMTIDADSLEADLAKTFKKRSDNPTLAANMATDIDKACSAANTVTETSVGNGSGPAIGKFSGDKTKISVPLAACFEAMNGMRTGGGNEYYAKQFSLGVHAYLTAGTITVQLKSPLSGSGSGKIT